MCPFIFIKVENIMDFNAYLFQAVDKLFYRFLTIIIFWVDRKTCKKGRIATDLYNYYGEIE